MIVISAESVSWHLFLNYLKMPRFRAARTVFYGFYSIPRMKRSYDALVSLKTSYLIPAPSFNFTNSHNPTYIFFLEWKGDEADSPRPPEP